MKCFIFDLSNDGIIWTGTNLSVASRLRQGILDCEIGVVYPSQAKLYGALAVGGSTNVQWNHKHAELLPLPVNAINPLYLEKKELANLRSPAFGQLMLVSTIALKRIFTTPVPTIENDLTFALMKCKPELDQYDFSVTEYAMICGMSAADAYKELSLYVENMQTQKIRVFSYIEYFTKKLNAASAPAELTAIRAEIYKKFVQDSYI